MPLLIAAVLALIRSIIYSLREPRFRGLLLFVSLIVLLGTVFYPKTAAGKTFTIIL